MTDEMENGLKALCKHWESIYSGDLTLMHSIECRLQDNMI